MSTFLMPGTSEMEGLRQEVLALQQNNDWATLWRRLRSLPPLLAIEAMHSIPQDWVPTDKSESVLFYRMRNACWATYLSDFEQLSRSSDELMCLPSDPAKPKETRSITASPDGRWAFQISGAELRVLEPDTFAIKTKLEFYDLKDNVTAPLQICFSPDGKSMAVVSSYSYAVYTVSIVSLELFQTTAKWKFKGMHIPSMVFVSNNRLIVAGMGDKHRSLDKELSDGISTIVAEGILIELSTRSVTAIKIKETPLSKLAVDLENQRLAVIEEHSELVGCCPDRKSTVAVLNSSGEKLAESAKDRDKHVNIMFVQGGYLVCEQQTKLQILKADTLELVREFKMPLGEFLFRDLSRACASPDGRILAFLESSTGRPGDSEQLRVLGFPEMSTLLQCNPQQLCQKARWPSAVLSLAICGNRLLVEKEANEECTGMHSISLGLRNTPWEYATELRRVSCTPIEQITEETRNLLSQAREDNWLTLPQRRWLNAVVSTLELNQG